MTQPKNVLIVGGVAGGMSAATRLRRLDESAKITVIEKGPYISYANCGIPYNLGGVIENESSLHLQTVPKIKGWFDVDVHVNTELIRINRQNNTATVRDNKTGLESALSYDKLILAMGAEAFVPPIKGVRSKHVFHLQTIPDLQQIEAYIKENNVRRAAVLGGGFIGLEAVENLRKRGLEVSLFEYKPHVFPLVDGDIANRLDAELVRNGVDLALNTRVLEITDSEILADGRGLTPADLVIVAVGIRARSAIAKEAGLAVGKAGVTVNEAMQTSDPDIYAVGDMVETQNLVAGTAMQTALAGPANRQGRLAADHIAGRPARYRGNVGTAVVQVFDLTAGLVGLSTTNLERMGIPHEYVTVHPPQHASWYPGGTPMTMKVAFEAPSGKILGAQIVGGEGVDKRIDVLATAMRGGLTIEDLEHLELGYAPPYGAAKDAVNMAGFVGGNVLRGDVKIVHAENFVDGGLNLDDYQVVDVRSPEEYARGHVKGAVNIPIGVLRERMTELRQDKKTLTYCWVGYRGYLAYRVLVQHGFDVVNLDGGFKAVSEGGYKELQA